MSLNKAKTEREFVTVVEDMAIQNGFISLDKILLQGTNIEAGMKIYILLNIFLMEILKF